ncbi:MAG: class I SAM-dependent methyltransferase [Desulfurococcales archaeon]|nr:class I SAM-dependent methyltransferase [Desulfurococcales archaeon]
MSTAPVFDVYAERYDAWYRVHRLVAESEVLAAREALRGSRGPCLEVGVGSGFFASRLGCDYGVDPSPAMLRLARARGIQAILGRGEALPIAASRLPSILIVVTICFADDPQALLSEAARALEAGGVLALCIVPRDTPWGRLYWSQARLGHPLYSKARFYTLQEAAAMLARAGLEVEGVVATLSYPPWARPRVEEPHPYTGKEGFACIRATRGDEVARKGGGPPWGP